MKKVLTVLVAMMIVCSVSYKAAAAKDEGVQSGSLKLAVVDLNRALNEVPEGKKAKANLESEFQAKKAELTKLENSLKTMRDDLEKQRQVLSQEAMKAKAEDFQKQYMDYQTKAKMYTEELAKKEGESTGKIINKLRTVVESIAAKEGYTYVFEKSQGGVLVGPGGSDITSEVIKQYK